MLQNQIYKQLLLIGLISCIIIFWYVSARNGFPILGMDTTFFLPTSYFLEKQNLLINNLYNPTHASGNRFLIYPPFFPWLVSKLNHFFNGNAKVFLSLFSLQMLSFLIGIRTIFIIYKGRISKNFIFLFVSIIALAACLSMAYSRPESLCKLLLIVYLFSISIRSSKLIYFIHGVLIALSILTSFVFGLYLILAHLFYLNVSERINLKQILYSTLGALTIIILFVFLYPYPIKDLLLNMQIHGENSYVINAIPFDLSDFVSVHILSVDNSFGIILFIYSIYLSFLLIKFIYGSRTGLIKGLLFFTVFLIMLFSIKRLAMSYYLYVLSPLFIFVILKYESIIRNKTAVSIIILILFSTSFFRMIFIVNYSILNEKINIDKFSNDIENVIPDKEATIYYTRALWPVLIKYPNASSIPTTTQFSDSISMKPNYIVLQQVYSNRKNPPSIKNYELIVNKFDSTPVKLFKLKLASQANAYEYAIYKKIKL
jgi:hypothetical protein